MKTPIEIHVTLFGNHVDYVLPLAQNLAWTKKNRTYWRWVLHVDDSVQDSIQKRLLALGSSTNKIIEHKRSEFATLWRYEVAWDETKRGNTVAVLDADTVLTRGGIVRILDTFASAGGYGMLLQKPLYSYTTFIPQIQARLAVFRFSVDMDVCIPGWNKRKELLEEFNKNNAGTPEIVGRGTGYMFDEFFLTKYALPVWKKLAPVTWIAVKDPPETQKLHPTRYILRELGILGLSLSFSRGTTLEHERAIQLMQWTPYRYRSEVAKRFVLRYRPDFCYEKLTI